MLKFDQWVPSSVCLECRGCCRYSQSSGVWLPFFLYGEITELVNSNILPCGLFSHANVYQGRGGRIQAVKSGDHFFCPCFDVERNACKIYAQRPLDCQLYPFLLARKGDEAFLAVDKKCPHVALNRQAAEWNSYLAYLRPVLESDAFLSLIQKDPDIVADYGPDPDAEFLAPLVLLNKTLH